MRAIVLFWSVNGTTKRVAERIAAGIQEAGAGCELHDLREGPPPAIAPYELVGIGLPVHYYRMPAPVRDAVVALGSLAGRSAFAFVVNGTYRGAALNQVRAALRRAGAREIGVFTCRGEDRFFAYERAGYLFSPGHPSESELAAAYEFGRGLPAAHAAALEGVVPTAVRRDPPTFWVYALERMSWAPWLVRAVYSRWFHVDRDRCVRCGRCAHVCPTGNIACETGRLPVWGRNCVGCHMCAEVCPESAVSAPLDWLVFRLFVRYNVRRAARDPAIDHVRVELRRGRPVRIGEDPDKPTA